MKQRKCCVSWYHYRDFVEEFPHLVPIADRLFVVDGKRITCSGSTGVADLAAQLVSKKLGHSVTQNALHILLVDRRRSESSAQPMPPFEMDSDDIRVSRAFGHSFKSLYGVTPATFRKYSKSALPGSSRSRKSPYDGRTPRVFD
jgi:hypothetical protein